MYFFLKQIEIWWLWRSWCYTKNIMWFKNNKWRRLVISYNIFVL